MMSYNLSQSTVAGVALYWILLQAGGELANGPGPEVLGGVRLAQHHESYPCLRQVLDDSAGVQMRAMVQHQPIYLQNNVSNLEESTHK